MIWIGVYLLVGLFVILAISHRHEKKGLFPTALLFLGDVWFLPIAIVLWPLIALIAMVDDEVQTHENADSELRKIQREKERPEDLSKFIGLTGTALTPLAPHGLIALGDRQFQAVSEDGYLPVQTEIRVIRIAAFSELAVGKVEAAGSEGTGKIGCSMTAAQQVKMSKEA